MKKCHNVYLTSKKSACLWLVQMFLSLHKNKTRFTLWTQPDDMFFVIWKNSSWKLPQQNSRTNPPRQFKTMQGIYREIPKNALSTRGLTANVSRRLVSSSANRSWITTQQCLREIWCGEFPREAVRATTLRPRSYWSWSCKRRFSVAELSCVDNTKPYLIDPISSCAVAFLCKNATLWNICLDDSTGGW